MIRHAVLFLLLLLLSFEGGCRRAVTVPPHTPVQFTDSILLPATAVKNQAKSGTCWAFGGISLLESDLLRDLSSDHDLSAGSEIDLSEMWLVRQAYYEKAVRYVRTRGYGDFSQGGELHDALRLAGRYGVVPQSVYEGNSSDGRYDHAALARAVHRCARQIVNRKRYLNADWQQLIQKLLDEELGPCPERFCMNGIEYTPRSYADSLGIRADHYVSFTSFLHHPFYTSFALELADNWMGEPSVNIPLDRLTDVLDYALGRGYTVGWCGNTADRGFHRQYGIAGVGKGEICTEQSRQRAFDTQALRDAHVLHIVGIARRGDGRIFYKAKNSWGAANLRGGYIYLSENYLRKNTVELVVNRNAVRPGLLEKCDLTE